LEVILELVSAGIISADKLELGGNIKLPPLRFRSYMPEDHSLEPVSKRIRAAPSSHLSLEAAGVNELPRSEAEPTETNIPRPAWAAALKSLHVNLGEATLLEHLLRQHPTLAKCPSRLDDEEFKCVLWDSASQAFHRFTVSLTLDSPRP